MVLNLAEKLHKKYPKQPFDKSFVRGYSDEEIKKIERLYDIEVPPTSQLYDFLKCMGRCSGGLFGGDQMIIYWASRNVRDKVCYQNFNREDIIDLGFDGANSNKVFFISCIYLTQYYFLATKSKDINIVYHWNENTDEIVKTEFTLYQYLEWILSDDTIAAFSCSEQELIETSGELIDF
ncbi:hypothetical protein VQ643_16135 [Pseudomonas sp. F1_0610]|uniref:hypothetical protein n=1 Tax=Pseudomonas sp. F1_0610 TaxID=3114284 RepID=UPI0039C2B10E